MITTGEAKAAPQPTTRTRSWATARRGLAAWWGGRGWWGGLIALGLAGTGQQILITRNDAPLAARYYSLAAVLLIIALTHLDLSGLRRRGSTLPAPPAPAPAPAIPVRRARKNGTSASTASGSDAVGTGPLCLNTVEASRSTLPARQRPRRHQLAGWSPVP